MSDADVIAAQERRAFGLHPKILLTIMREQAGTLAKALLELVMNSVDAGASRVDLTIGQASFSLQDDGKGFTSREQLENFFEVFGTPHDEKGDAYYGRFRIGRGQIMSYARTVWRSGHFEMRVDIANESSNLGYDLVTHDNAAAGCRIEGEFYEPNHSGWRVVGADFDWGIDHDFLALIRYIPIPVVVNGRLANRLPGDEAWDFEDEVAWYRLSRGDDQLSVYNRGALVEHMAASCFGTGGVVVTKQPLAINMARNAILRRCPVWAHVLKRIALQFKGRLMRAKKLDADERGKLIDDLLFGEDLYPDEAKQLRKIRFIPDIFGELRSPDQFLSGASYTLFDGKHTMIAERAQKQGRATVVMPEMFYRTRLKLDNDATCFHAVRCLQNRLFLSRECSWVPFGQLVREMNDTSVILDDEALTPEELLVLRCLRNLDFMALLYYIGADSVKNRKLFAGDSDTNEAWTDGSTFNAINRRVLRGIRDSGGAARLVMVVIHEYCHQASSLGNHGHDFEFYSRFHRAALLQEVGGLTDQLLRSYVAGLCKAEIVPSAYTGRHVRYLGEKASRLKSRCRSTGLAPSVPGAGETPL